MGNTTDVSFSVGLTSTASLKDKDMDGLIKQAELFFTEAITPDMPVEELSVAAARSRSEAIVLSGSVHLDLKGLLHDIETLVKSVDVPVFIGGKTSSIFFDDIVRIGAIPLGDDIFHGIKRIISELHANATRV